MNSSISNYTVQLNISLETSEYIVYDEITNVTSLEYNMTKNGILNLCNISSVTVNVYAHNKVGIGEAVETTIPPYIELCLSSSVVINPSSVILTVTSKSVASLVPGLKVLPSNVNNNRMLVFGMYR